MSYIASGVGDAAKNRVERYYYLTGTQFPTTFDIQDQLPENVPITVSCAGGAVDISRTYSSATNRCIPIRLYNAVGPNNLYKYNSNNIDLDRSVLLGDLRYFNGATGSGAMSNYFVPAAPVKTGKMNGGLWVIDSLIPINGGRPPTMRAFCIILKVSVGLDSEDLGADHD